MSDWDSAYYKNHAKLQEKTTLSLLGDLEFKGDEHILDVGCGDGKISKHLAEKVPRGEVVGIDPSDNMIREAREDYSPVSNLQFIKCGAEDFSFPGRFDLITSFFALHWVEDHARFLKNCREALKKRGRVLFLIVSGGNPLIGEVFEREPWRSHIEEKGKKFVSVTADSYRELLNQHHFYQDQVALIPFIHHFDTIDRLAGHFMTWIPFAMGLETKQSQQLAKEIALNIALSQGRRENIALTTSLLLVKAHL